MNQEQSQSERPEAWTRGWKSLVLTSDNGLHVEGKLTAFLTFTIMLSLEEEAEVESPGSR